MKLSKRFLFILIVCNSFKLHDGLQLENRSLKIPEENVFYNLEINYKNNTIYKECRDVRKISKSSQCEFMKKNCENHSASFFNYLQLYYCTLSNARYVVFMFILTWAFILFSAIGIGASDFLCPNLNTISNILGMSQSLAGVTLVALGNGAPDIFSTYAAFSINSGSLAIGELIGAAAFITSVVAGSMGVIRPFKVSKKSFLRDVCFFLIAVVMILIFVMDKKLKFWECLCMILFYISYVVFAAVLHWRATKNLKKKISETNSRNHFTSPGNEEQFPHDDDANNISSSYSYAYSPSASQSQAVPPLADLDQNIPDVSSDLEARQGSDNSLQDIENQEDAYNEFTHALLMRAHKNSTFDTYRSGSVYAGNSNNNNPYPFLSPSVNALVRPNIRRPSLFHALEFNSIVNNLRSNGTLASNQSNSIVMRRSRGRDMSRTFRPSFAFPRTESYASLPTNRTLNLVSNNSSRTASRDSSSIPSPNVPRKPHSIHSLDPEDISPNTSCSPINSNIEVNNSQTTHTDPNNSHIKGAHNENTAGDLKINTDSGLNANVNSNSVSSDNNENNLNDDDVPKFVITTAPSNNSSIASRQSKSPTILSKINEDISEDSTNLDENVSSSNASASQTLSVSTNISESSQPALLSPQSINTRSINTTEQSQTPVQVELKTRIKFLFLPSYVYYRLFQPLIGFKGKTFVNKVTSIFLFPIVFFFTITIPITEDVQSEVYNKPLHNDSLVVTDETNSASTLEILSIDERTGGAIILEDYGWRRWLFATQCFACPTFISLNVFPLTILYILPGISIGIISCLSLLYFTKANVTPSWLHWFSLLGFAGSLTWISLIANEVVGVLKALGIIFGISDAILGLTVFAIGNSLGDFIADTTIARMGYPIMALGACFGGPMLNILLGTGVSGIILIMKSRSLKTTIDINFSLSIIVSSMTLLSTLLLFAVYVPLNKWKISRLLGIITISIWVISTLINIFIETIGY